MPIRSPYQGVTVALATRHGKERVIARALRQGLGAELLHVREVDTDALGTFCGGVPRRGTALEACIAKAEAALAAGGTEFAIASEGSFGPHPQLPLLAAGMEWLVFLDRRRGLTISEQALARRTNFAHRLVASPGDAAPDPALAHWLEQVGFPSHALMVRAHQGAAGVEKGLREWRDLALAIARAAAASSDGLALVETDMRAHRNPTRMAAIRRLAFRLVRRLASPCPACQSPGWGVVGQRQGLPCADCGLPTAVTRALVWGCARCEHQEERPCPDALGRADPGRCDWCNP
ncbi:MAG: DUF6671 family protein [Cyanobacteriota bacterium]|nr:DUF6671 family protein [Cyanobacteriota bacterium]